MRGVFAAIAVVGTNGLQILQSNELSCGSCAPVRNGENFACTHPHEHILAQYRTEMSTQEQFCSQNCMVVTQGDRNLACENARAISLLETSALENMFAKCAPAQEC